MPNLNQKSGKIGRPTKDEVSKAKFRTFTFYFPLRIEKVWKEFDKLSRKEEKISKVFPERCKSLRVRKLILKFVYENTENYEIKKMIKDYLDKEKGYQDKVLENYYKKE
jgi:hypothetical protein